MQDCSHAQRELFWVELDADLGTEECVSCVQGKQSDKRKSMSAAYHFSITELISGCCVPASQPCSWARSRMRADKRTSHWQKVQDYALQTRAVLRGLTEWALQHCSNARESARVDPESLLWHAMLLH